MKRKEITENEATARRSVHCRKLLGSDSSHMIVFVSVRLELVGLVRRQHRKLSRQHFVLAEQAGLLEHLHVRKIAQRLQAEVRQERFCRHVGVGGP